MIVNVHDENIKLADLIQAAQNGEAVFILAGEDKTFKLVQVDVLKKRRKAGSAKGLIEMSDDFDAPLEDFKDYMPAKKPKQESRKFGTAKGQFKISDDFNASVNDFDEL